MMVTRRAAITSGSQPPCVILATLAAKNTASTQSTRTTATTVFHSATRQTEWARTRKSSVVSSRVPVTARPYADASAADDWKMPISSRTPTYKNPVEGADVDLSALLAGRVLDVLAGEQAEAVGLTRHGEGARNDGLGRDDGRNGGQGDERERGPLGGEVEEGLSMVPGSRRIMAPWPR